MRHIQFWSVNSILLGLTLALPLSPTAAFAGDGKGAAIASAALGVLGATMGVVNTVKSTTCCASESTACPDTFGQCWMLPLNVISTAASIYSVVTSLQSKGGQSGGGTPTPDIQPTPDPGAGDGSPCASGSLPAALCADCSTNPAGNPLCNRYILDNVPPALGNLRTKLTSGELAPQGGKSLAESLAEIDQALGALGALSGNFDGLGGADLGSSDTGDLAGSRKNGAGRGGQSGFSDSDGGSGSDSSFGSGGKAGPLDRSGLGKTNWNGSLDMLDEATGKSLTLWQRATRRYQGIGGARAFLMARTESIRSQARRAMLAKEEPSPAKKLVGSKDKSRSPASESSRKIPSIKPARNSNSVPSRSGSIRH